MYIGHGITTSTPLAQSYHYHSDRNRFVASGTKTYDPEFTTDVEQDFPNLFNF
jgi:hypothetical protein